MNFVAFFTALTGSKVGAQLTLHLQVVGSRGTIEINPRETMAKESSIVGVLLPRATEVRKIRKQLTKLFNRYNNFILLQNVMDDILFS